jgi:hypothetical protein
MDLTEVVSPGPAAARLLRRLSRALSSHAGLAHWVLPVAAFLLGVTLSAVAFVGVWRHAASQSDRARAARTSADHRLRQALAQVGRLEHTVAKDRALLARARTAEHTLAARLATLERTNGAVADRLPGQIAAVETTATALARQSASLASALSSLQTYLAANGGSTIDPGFLSAQVRYLTGVSRAGEASASRLKGQLGAVASTTSSLTRRR